MAETLVQPTIEIEDGSQVKPILPISTTVEKLIQHILTVYQFRLVRKENGEIFSQKATLGQLNISKSSTLILQHKFSQKLQNLQTEIIKSPSVQVTSEGPLRNGINQQQNIHPPMSIQVKLNLSVEQNDLNRTLIDLHRKLASQMSYFNNCNFRKSPQGELLDGPTQLSHLVLEDRIRLFCNLGFAQISDINVNSQHLSQQSDLSIGQQIGQNIIDQGPVENAADQYHANTEPMEGQFLQIEQPNTLPDNNFVNP